MWPVYVALTTVVKHGARLWRLGATTSWFDKLTMRSTERTEGLILSLSKDEVRPLACHRPLLAAADH